MNQRVVQTDQEWLKVLGKGMVTLPKKWRDELGIVSGDIIKVKKEGNRVIIEGKKELAPYRIYTDAEIDSFILEDKISENLVKQVKKNLAVRQ